MPIRDKSGAIVGVHGRFVQIGTPYIARKDGTIHAVRDSVAAYLGGESGTIVIGKRTLHLSAAQRTGNVDRLAYDGPLNRLAQSGVPSDVSRCSNGYCVHDSSFITNLFFYKSLGGETDETAGGFQTSSHFCWNGFLPWVCTTSSGHNVMSINNTFFAFMSPIDHDSAWHADTQSLTVKEWAIGTVLGIVGDMTGVCSTHDPGQPFGATTLKAEQGMPACS